MDNTLSSLASPTCSTPLIGVSSSSLDELAKILHLQLGHASFFKIKLLHLEINIGHVKERFFFCTICPAIRQHRRNFPINSTNTSFAFELLYVDTWGPYSHKTHNGCNFFLTIMDDYTKVTWIYLIKNKNNYVSILDQFFNYIHTQFHTNVKYVPTDNAQELYAGNMLNLYHSKGIIHQFSCRDTP